MLSHMASRKNAGILDQWRITHMESWESNYVDAEVKAFIRVDPKGHGEFQFGYVSGWMDHRLVDRDGRPGVEWSWEGNAEMDPCSGRGWAVLGADGALTGEIFIHDGDDSPFTAKRKADPRKRNSA